MLTNEGFAALVRRAEGLARAHPQRYRLRVGLLAITGYAYVWLVLAACLAGLALLIWMFATSRSGAAGIGKLAIALVLVIGAVLKALWVQFPEPVGVRVAPPYAPALFALLRDLVAALDTPRVHRVLLTDDFNAAVTQHPRLGAFGWYRNYLLLGLPLMRALSPEEFKGVLAHELGHLSRQHGRFGAWIYRVRMTWMRLVEQLEHHWGHRLFDWFLNLWAPPFNAYSFVLAREQEYEADRFAAQLAGAEPLGHALVTLEVQGAHLDREFWPALFRTAVQRPEPPAGVLGLLSDSLRGTAAAEHGRRRLVTALNRQTGIDDTHPSLADRLRALNVTASAPGPVKGRDAAEHYLGSALAALTAQVEALWHAAVAEGWRRKHQQDVRDHARLEALEARAASGPLDREAAGQRAELTLNLRGPDASVDALRGLLAVDPENGLGNYALGRILLDQGDAGGVPHVERAMAADPSCRADGYESIRAFYEEQGQAAEAARYQQRVWEHGDRQSLAEVERRDVQAGDTLLPHGLETDQVTAIREALAAIAGLAEAYLVRKQVTHLPEEPFYVLGVKRRVPWYRFESEGADSEFVQQVARTTPLPGAWLIVSLTQNRSKIRAKMRKVAGAQLV